MPAQQRNSESPQELPFIRSHSPYCEATGPIVERGFVAAQIRALQGAYNRAWTPLRSHSPMVPCPIDQRLQRYESGTPQVPRKPSKKSHQHQPSQSSESFANGVSKPVQNAYSRRSILSSSGSDNIGLQKQQGADFARKLKRDRPNFSKTEKTKIRTISRSNSSTGSNQWTNAHVSSPRLLTKATELMSGGGRNGQTININSESASRSVKSEDHQRVQSPKLKIAEELTSMIDLELEKRHPPCEANGSSDSSSGKPKDRFPGISLSAGTTLFLSSSEKKSASLLNPIGNDGSKLPGDSAQRKMYQHRRKLRQKKSAEALTTNRIKTKGEAIEEILTTPKRIQRAWSFPHPHRSKRKAADPTKLRSFSVGHNFSHNNHDRNHDSHDRAQDSPSEPGQQQNLSSRSKSSHHCSIETSNLSRCSQSGRSTDKSSNLYVTPPEKAPSKWRWWKLVFIDKQANTSDSSSQTPSLAASIKFEDDQHSYQSSSRHGQEQTQGSKVMHTLSGCGQRVEIQKVRPRMVEEPPKLEHYHDLKMRGSRHASNACSTTSSVQLTSQMPKGGNQEEQVSEWVAKLPKNEPLEGCSRVLHCKLQTSCSKEPTEGQHNRRGQRVKEVQVIVSLDGATDFIVKTYLEKSPRDISGVL